MTTLLLATTAPPQPPAVPEADAKQLAAWVADLSAKEYTKQGAARDALIQAGPKAKAVVPDLIKLVEARKQPGSTAWFYAVEVLGALGPDARDAAPALKEMAKTDSGDN